MFGIDICNRTLSAAYLHALSDAADDEVDGDGGVNGDLVAAPARAEDAEIAAVNCERGFKAGEVANAGHNARADDADGNGDALGDSVNRQIAGDV